MLSPQSAEAYRVVVRYDDTGRPGTLTTFGVVRTIQSVMREYESVSAGQVVLDWGGVSTSRTVGTGNIAIYWDVGMGACADVNNNWSEPFSNGALRINPLAITTLETLSAVPTCEGVRVTLLHEFAHYFQQVDGHPAGSRVLTETSGSLQDSWMAAVWPPAGNARPMMHLWDADVSAYPCDVVGDLSFCKHQTYLTVSQYDPWALTETQLSFFSAARPATAAMGLGGPSNSLALVASNGAQIYVNQGSGSTWSLTNLIPEGTIRQACVASASNSAEMLVAWPFATEEAIDPHVFNPNVPADVVRGGQIGARAIRFALSHDGGVTFDAPQFLPLPGVLTRAGVSCSWNPNRNTFVVAWQSGYPTDAITLAERPALVAGAWTVSVPTVPAGVAAATSHESPRIYFNPFGGPSEAYLLWQQSTDMVTKVAQLSFSGGAYQLTAPSEVDGCPGFGCDFRYHRSLPSQTSIGGLLHSLTSRSTLSLGSSCLHDRIRDRFNLLPPAPLVVNQTSSTSYATPSPWTGMVGYEQVVEDRLFVRNAVLETYVNSTP
jgi:hypothetical protein